MRPEVSKKVQKILDDRLTSILTAEGFLSCPIVSTGAEESWNECLASVGARRVGKLVGMICQPRAGVVRLKDPLGNGGNHGFVEMDEETLNKVAALGLP